MIFPLKQFHDKIFKVSLLEFQEVPMKNFISRLDKDPRNPQNFHPQKF